ncbi:MAG: zinc-ribbon domain-containing protein [Promethearchaeota archaeon]
MADNVRSEDTLVFLAISPQNTNYPAVVEVITEFFTKKQEIDPQDRFNVIAFREAGPAYLEDYTYNIGYLARTLEALEKQLTTPNVAGGIFVALTFIIDVFKIVGGKCFRLVVVSDASAPALTKVEILTDLLWQVRDMPFIMDVVRYDVEDAAEDWKLEKLAKITKGELFHADDLGDLRKTMMELAEKKEFWDVGLGKKEFTIGVENIPFYENMADEPVEVPVSEQKDADKCSICFQKQSPTAWAEQDLVRCPKCGGLAHRSCWASWAQSSHVGLKHLFRCHQCFNLLTLPKEFVEEVQSGKPARVADGFAPSSQYDLLREKDANAPELVVSNDPFLAAMMELQDAKESASVTVADEKPTVCPNCGNSLPEGARFCNKCGTPVAKHPGDKKGKAGSISRISLDFLNKTSGHRNSR